MLRLLRTKRKPTVVALTVGIIFAGLSPVARAYEIERYTDRQEQTCRMARNGRMNEAEVRDTIRCFHRVWPSGLRKAMGIARRESGFKARAANPSSTAYGPYQWLVGSYDGARSSFRKPGRRWDLGWSRHNARSNIAVALIWMKRRGYSPWSLTR